MAKTKPVAKKATTKKTATKAKTPAKKATNAKAKLTASGRKDAAVKNQTRKGLDGVLRSKTPTQNTGKDAGILRRPDPNLPPTVNMVNSITQDILYLITELDNYAANLRALDRQRHNGVGLKRLGFIEAAFRLSTKFPQYFPHWLDTAKFQADLDLFNAVRSLVEVCRSLVHDEVQKRL